MTGIWSQLKHFKREENWGNPELIRPQLLLALDKWADLLSSTVIISCGTQGKHAPTSKHYSGEAVDVVLPHNSRSLFDTYLMAERFNFSSIGLYSYWKYNDTVVGGLHLEVSDHVGRWISVEPGKYIALNKANLVRYF